ncbi:MAG: hypothetical protein K2K97_01065 [Muribaculaceae bacterium]|nr:hypothetical protein [Muribaculaceae bacterium]
MEPSVNTYDWLGSGIYFWEGDVQRAYEFARDTKKCKDPFAIGAILNLGYCFDLTSREDLDLLKFGWESVVVPSIGEGIINKPARRGENGELMLRYLDCYVINALHKFNKSQGIRQFDSVRGAFWEGEEVYPTAGFREKSHIQLCICNQECILGLFLPKGYSF